MNKKIAVGILGATGMVGQHYLRLLENHPWFEVTYLAASSHSAGLKYRDALKQGWHASGDMPAAQADRLVHDVADIKAARNQCAFVFSAFDMPDKDAVRAAENEYAQHMPVFSNASAHRSSPDVPMIIAEINPGHLSIIPQQQQKREWKGFIVVKPNCSLQSYLTPLYALMKAGYAIDRVAVTTLQAVSGAGYPGVPTLDMIDNVVPFISGEEEKTECEPLKILGDLVDESFVPYEGIRISAHCNRVPVTDGHLANVMIGFKDKKPSRDDIISIWKSFSAEPQTLDLPMAPRQAIIYLDQANRPQPKRDRDSDKGMAVSVGRLRPCPLLDYKFSALSHNTVRGAAGGGILNAELAFKKMPHAFA